LELLAALAIGNFGFLIPAAILAEKFGRKIIMLIGSGLMFISVGIMSFVQSFSYFLLIPFFLSGIGMAIMITNMYPAIISFCGKSEYAKFTGYYYTSTMLAQAITPALAGLFMSAYFNGSYHRLMPYAAIFTLLCFIA
jgi:Major Facilitator Superfamily.